MVSTPSAERPSGKHILALDGYRGLAFLLVFARHYTLTSHVSTRWVLALSNLGATGWIGVDLFFVLSGFLITGILLDTRTDAHYFRNFIVRRTLRIFPLYYTVLFALLALTPLLHLHWLRGQIGYFFYLGNIVPYLNPANVGLAPYFCFVHLWSLALEEQFYLLWPLAIYLAGSGTRVIRVCVALSVFGFLARIAVLHWVPGPLAYEWASAELPTRMDGLLYGAVLAVLVRRYPIGTLVRYARPVSALSGLAIAAIFYFVGTNFAYRITTLIGYPLLALFFASLLTLALHHGSFAARFGSFAPLRTLGRYSYGLYVYHMIAANAVQPLQPWLQARTGSMLAGGILFTLAVFFGTLVVSVASYELYERHFLRLKRYFHYGPSTSAPSASAIQTA